ALALRLLEALRWRGVAMVEFRRDRRTREYRLLEINPRFWGSLPLALHCGLDFPVYQAQLALGRAPSPPPSYPVGRKMRFLLPDLATVARSCRAARSVAPALPFVRDLLDLGIRDGLFELDDPLPSRTALLGRLESMARRHARPAAAA
ncbi:MAG: ATP-grasp domain-containing protein, partial [Candidatus Rokuibacteriota bacterium]